MRKVRTMIGMLVICRRKKIGRMIQADLSEDLRQMNGIWISSGLRGTRYIPSENLEMLGDMAIMADDCGKRKRMTSSPIFYRAISTDGRRLGAITGAEINALSFAVESLELSNGVWDDFFNRRDRIIRYTANRKTGEVIIDSVEEEKEERSDEKRYDKGSDCRHAHRRFSGDDSGRYELENRKGLEYEGPQDRKMDIR